jgi:hypothetical protein
VGIRRFPPQRGLLSEIYLFFKALSTYSEVFLCYIDIWFLTYGIRAQGLGVSLLHLRHLGIFAITIFSTMFQKERLGGYLVDGSRYVGLKFHLLRPYNFGDTACER